MGFKYGLPKALRVGRQATADSIMIQQLIPRLFGATNPRRRSQPIPVAKPC